MDRSVDRAVRRPVLSCMAQVTLRGGDRPASRWVSAEAMASHGSGRRGVRTHARQRPAQWPVVPGEISGTARRCSRSVTSASSWLCAACSRARTGWPWAAHQRAVAACRSATRLGPWRLRSATRCVRSSSWTRYSARCGRWRRRGRSGARAGRAGSRRPRARIAALRARSGHPRDGAAAGRGAPQGRAGAARSRDHLDHARHLLARHPDDAARRRRFVRRGGVRVVNPRAEYQRSITGPDPALGGRRAIALTCIFCLLMLCPRGELYVSHNGEADAVMASTPPK
jgi:hypothetical protein